MIKTVIFDIGNVLAAFCWEKHFHDLGLEGDIFERVADATVRSDDWNHFDRGDYTEEALLQIFIGKDPGVQREIRLIFQDISGAIAPYPYAESWIRELKDWGYRVLILSNFAEKTFRECGKKLSFLDEADGGILSYRERLIKPEPAIYRLLIERYRLVPEECVFLDDLQRNLDAAEAFGIHTVLVKNREQAAAKLEKLGVRKR